MIKVVNESINDGKKLFFVRYSYEGDELSNYETTVICIADTEEEALRIAKKYCDEGIHFDIDKSMTSKFSSLDQYYKRYPNSNLRVYNAKGMTDLGESINRTDSGEPVKRIAHKSVPDADGFYTDYTLYKIGSGRDEYYVCILGDNEVYDVNNTEPDAEFDNLDEAQDWFDIYEGFEDEDDY